MGALLGVRARVRVRVGARARVRVRVRSRGGHDLEEEHAEGVRVRALVVRLAWVGA